MKKDNWKTNYEIATHYYKENGNLLVPSQYKANETVNLGQWISRQRQLYREEKLSKEKIELLENIGMVWSIYDLQWYEYYELAVDYYNKNNNLMIPLKYSIDDRNLGHWIGSQRKKYQASKLSKEKIELLEKIGMVWSIYDSQWYEYYNLSTEYYNENGNLLVPLRYKTSDNINLGSWISHQRRDYKSGKLSDDRIALLEKIGMAWDGMNATWEDMYKLAKQYYEEHNNLSISSTTFTYRNASLGSWIVTQRKNYSEDRLSNEQIAMLSRIGMEWIYTNNPDYVWDKNYNTVLDFYSRYKHLYIPINYVTKDGVRIGVWLYDRKLEYERNELSEDRKRKLDELDKTWLEPINTKSSFPEQAVLFYVKKAFPSATKLSTKDISEIDIYIPELKTGVEYDGPSHNRRVKQDIEKGRACEKHGIQLIRIRDCECPIINDGSFIIVLKDNSFEALEEGISKLLNYLGMPCTDIDIKKDYIEISDNYIKTIDLDWYESFEKLKKYYCEYGNINVPIHYKTADGFSLGHWLSNMRYSAKNPNAESVRLNSNKIKLLNELGMDWSPIETQWKKIFDLAEKYYKEHGNLLIPGTYVTNEGVKLGRWIGTQRYNYKERILSEEKISKLESIGMIWDVNDYQWMKMYDLAKEYYRENGHLKIPAGIAPPFQQTGTAIPE